MPFANDLKATLCCYTSSLLITFVKKLLIRVCLLTNITIRLILNDNIITTLRESISIKLLSQIPDENNRGHCKVSCNTVH